MIQLAWELLPVAFGIIASPLAIIALVAVLLSSNARLNGVLYLLGWAIAVTAAVLVWYALLASFHPKLDADVPAWAPYIRLALGALLAAGAVWTYRRSRAQISLMASATTPGEISQAAPQLPGWLRAVESFSPQRSFSLGLGIFLLNPINVSCAVVAALEIRLAGLASPAPALFLAMFILLGIIPLSLPVALVFKRREHAGPALERIRSWIAAHNGTLSAVFLAVIAFMQIQKALAELPWA